MSNLITQYIDQNILGKFFEGYVVDIVWKGHWPLIRQFSFEYFILEVTEYRFSLKTFPYKLKKIAHEYHTTFTGNKYADDDFFVKLERNILQYDLEYDSVYCNAYPGLRKFFDETVLIEHLVTQNLQTINEAQEYIRFKIREKVKQINA